MKLHRTAGANEVVCCCGRTPLPLALFCVLRRALIGSSRGARETPVDRPLQLHTLLCWLIHVVISTLWLKNSWGGFAKTQADNDNHLFL